MTKRKVEETNLDIINDRFRYDYSPHVHLTTLDYLTNDELKELATNMMTNALLYNNDKVAKKLAFLYLEKINNKINVPRLTDILTAYDKLTDEQVLLFSNIHFVLKNFPTAKFCELIEDDFDKFKVFYSSFKQDDEDYNVVIHHVNEMIKDSLERREWYIRCSRSAVDDIRKFEKKIKFFIRLVKLDLNLFMNRRIFDLHFGSGISHSDFPIIKLLITLGLDITDNVASLFETLSYCKDDEIKTYVLNQLQNQIDNKL